MKSFSSRDAKVYGLGFLVGALAATSGKYIADTFIEQSQEPTQADDPENPCIESKQHLIDSSIRWITRHREEIIKKAVEDCLASPLCEESEESITMVVDASINYEDYADLYCPKSQLITVDQDFPTQNHYMGANTFRNYNEETGQKGAYAMRPFSFDIFEQNVMCVLSNHHIHEMGHVMWGTKDLSSHQAGDKYYVVGDAASAICEDDDRYPLEINFNWTWYEPAPQTPAH